MNENINIMLEKLAKDEETLKKLSAVRDPDEAYAIVIAIQGGYTKDEFVETMKALNEQLNQDLDEKDLATASGGTDAGEVVEAVTKATASGVATAVISYSAAGLTWGVVTAVGGASSAAV